MQIMKNRWVTVLAAAVIIAGCTGPKGDKGDPGSNGTGQNSLVNVTAEAAGANCATGGQKIEVGLDANNNGTLDASEVNAAATKYVCNGAGGAAGQNTVVATSAEPAGVNCATGGVKMEFGLDANGNGTLDASEVNAALTTYTCNGAGGLVGPAGQAGPSSASTGLHIAVTSVSTSATGPISVRFTLKDDRGWPVDRLGVYSVNTVFAPRFALGFITLDASNNVMPLNVLTKSGTTPQPTAFTAGSTGQGTIVENGSGQGDYTYTFPSTSTAGGAQAVAYDPTMLSNTHVLWIQASRQVDTSDTNNTKTFTAVNQEYDFIPSGTGTIVHREVVKGSNCASCHRGFKPEGSVANGFHGSGRIDPLFCVVCHNPGRVSNPAAEAKVFVHRLHNSENLQTANLFHGMKFAYPQDIRNCDMCHKGAAQGAQAQGVPTRAACGSCHDYVDFTGVAAATCTDPVTVDAAGLPVPCKHMGGVRTDDTGCTGCHAPTDIAGYHLPVVEPDPNNVYLVYESTGATNGNSNTNAASMAAAGAVPAGANVVTYEVNTVDTVAVTGGVHARIKFRFLMDGVATPMQTYAAGTTTEIFPNFVGSPSVYFAFAVPQDGKTTPADFNATASGYIRNIWTGAATGAGAGILTGPDASNYYTIELTGVLIPTTATMLTGGVGYTYGLGSATSAVPFSGNTQPLTQTNVPGYPYTANPCVGAAAGISCGGTGGLIVPAPDKWKVATGYTARRTIVDNAKCNACHAPLGVAPSFHAGQRNDGPTCAFCHNPNRSSSGWSANAKDFIHSIHGARARTVVFNWHAPSATQNYGEVEFPGPLNDCTACHVAGAFDFSATASAAALPNLLASTAGVAPSGTIPTYGSAGGPAAYTLSPYVDTAASYGAGFSFAAATGVATQAAATTLVISPITAACVACHDQPMAVDHMQANGGSFYAPRSTAFAAGAPVEQCMLCHAKGKIAAIADVHK